MSTYCTTCKYPNYYSSSQSDYVDWIGEYSSSSTGYNETSLYYPGIAALDGASIVSATWSGYFDWTALCSAETFWMWQATSPFNLNATWNNGLPYNANNGVTGSVSANWGSVCHGSRSWANVNITPWVQEWTGGSAPNDGIIITSNSNFSSNYWMQLAAYSSAHPAYISVTYMTVPGAPTGVTATAGNAQATVSWVAPASNGGSAITGYRVTPYIGSTAGTTTLVSAPATSTTITGLINGTTYTFQVAATNAYGTGSATASAAVTPMTVPGAPTGATATAGNALATVSWVAPASNGGSAITGYTVTPYIGSTAGTATVVSAPATSTTITGLTNGTAYTFQVTATNAAGTGPATASAAVTPLTVPGAPTGVTATAGNALATVSWVAPVSNGGSAITGYTVTPYIGSTAGTATMVSAPATSTTITGLTNGTAYTFQVTATNAAGTGSATASAAVIPMTVAGAPTGVTAAAGNAQATVSWVAPVSNGGSAITGYTVTPYIGSTAEPATTVGATVTSTTITGLTNGTAYTFQVAATNALGTGPATPSAAVTPFTVPEAPTGVTATAGNAQATVSWVAPASNGGSAITGYTVTPYAGTTAEPATNVGATVTSTTITGLTNGTAYTFQVTAANAAGSGPTASSAAEQEQGPPISASAWSAAAGEGNTGVSAPVAPSNVVGSINGESGALYLIHSDITIGGLGLGLELDRTYNSPQQGSGTDGPFGYGWSSNVTMSLAENAADNAVTITDESGAPVTFTLAGATWTPSSYNASTLTSSGGTWTYTRWDGDSYTFNGSGQLTSEADRYGNTTTFAYSGGNLSTMTDPSGRTLTFTWTGSNITQVEDPDGQYVTYGYDAAGDLTSVTDQIGNVAGCGCAAANTTTYAYDGNHHLITQTDPLGNSTSYVYSAAGQVTSVTPPAGVGGASRQITYAYAAPAPNETTTTITAPDPNGDADTNITVDTYLYGLLTTQVRGEGLWYAVTTTYMYDPYTLGLVLQVASPGQITSNTYDQNGNLLSTVITSPSGKVTSTSATYNSLNEPLTQTDADGNLTTNAYSATGELCWSLDGTSSNPCTSVPSGATSYVYGDSSNPGLPTSESDAAGETTTMTYDSHGDLVTSANAAGDETSHTYDILSRQLTNVTPTGNAAGCGCAAANTTTTTYDPLNHVLMTTAPNGSGGWAVTTNTYDADGNLQTTEDPAGDWTTHTYDADSELCWTLVASSASSDPCTTVPTGATATTYDGDGNAATTTDAKGNVTTYAYNALSEKVSEAVDKPSGAVTSYTYDAHGNVLTVVNPDGNPTICTTPCNPAEYTTTYTYDADNRLLTTTDPDGYTTTNTYDGNGNILTVTDAAGNVTTNTYNDQNQLCWTYTGSAAQQSICGSPPSGATITTYDGDGHVLTVTDGNGNVTTNAYSDTGQLCWTYLGSSSNGCSSPPAGATVYTYDANGNLLTTTKPDGQPITNTYNTANQLCWTYQGVLNTPSCGSPPTSGTYAIFTHDPDGRVLTMTDPTGTSSWTYNALGQETSYTNGAGAEVQYTYDGNGNQTSITYPAGGIVVSEVYNADNQMCWTEVSSTISGNSCSSPPSGSTVYSYDASGNLLSEDLPNGVDNTYTYDGANNLMAISDKTSSGAPVFAATYARNGDDLVTSDSSQPAGAGQYEYTAKKQVCYAGSANSAACTSPPSGSYAYGYDPAGNLTGDNGTTQTFTSQDELCWSVTGSSSSPCSQPPAGATTYEYDANGDRTAVTPTTGTPAAYSYNTADQLTEYQLDGGTPTTYTYDGHGLRMSEATGSATTTFSWTDTGSVALLLQETTGAGTTSYVYGPAGSPIEEILPSGSVNYYSSDDLGSTRALTDASGNMQDTDTYDPYGNLTASAGSVQDHLLYAGQYLDSENGLYYLRARYYDPTTGQLLSIDPDVAITDTPYAYVIGDPVNATDASGKIPIALGGCGNPHNLAACVAAARRSGTMKGLTLKQVWTWIYSNRGMIVSVVAIGICVAAALPTAGGSLAVCGVASLVASGVRIQQRIAENGFMASLPANSADLFISSLTFGMVDTPTGLGSADVGAVGAAGLRLHSALPSIFNAATYQLERR